MHTTRNVCFLEKTSAFLAIIPCRLWVGPGPLEKTDIDLAYWSDFGQHPPMEPIHCNTLADFPPDKYMLLVYCCDCQRRPELNRSALPANTSIQALRPRLVCSACGSRSTQLDVA
jgi:hypothetical protein